MKGKRVGLFLSAMFCVALLTGCLATTMNNGASSCDEISQPFVDVMKCENKFIQDILANTNMGTIYAEVCFVEGLLGTRIALLPADFVNGLNEIKKIIEKAGGPYTNDKFSECNLMKVHGIRWRMADNLVQEAFRQYAPKIIQYLPVWMLFQ